MHPTVSARRAPGPTDAPAVHDAINDWADRPVTAGTREICPLDRVNDWHGYTCLSYVVTVAVTPAVRCKATAVQVEGIVISVPLG